MNVDLLMNKVLPYLEEEPRRFDMRWGIFPLEEAKHEATYAYFISDYGFMPEPPCGTVCCLAGAVAILSYPEWAEKVGRKNKTVWINVEQDAVKALGITYPQAEQLFYLSSWPPEFRMLYFDAKTPTERVQALRKRCEAFVAELEVI